MNKFKNLPTHVSMIMDGNGRWAENKGLKRFEGHLEGVKRVRSCLEYAGKLGLKYLSLFAFSEENWGRPETEVNFLMDIMLESLVKELPDLQKNNVRLLIKGNIPRLASKLSDMIKYCEDETAKNTGTTLVLFLSYSGKWDILQASQKLVEEYLNKGTNDGINIDYKDLEKYLITSDIPNPDLIIRTSGEKRISNFLIWQGAYSEFYFTDVLWPDFKEDEFEKALISFDKRERRYGKIK